MVDDDRFDEEEDFEAHYDTKYYLTDKGLSEHVYNCMYYGIPAYLGKDEQLQKRIHTLQEAISNNPQDE